MAPFTRPLLGKCSYSELFMGSVPELLNRILQGAQTMTTGGLIRFLILAHLAFLLLQVNDSILPLLPVL